MKTNNNKILINYLSILLQLLFCYSLLIIITCRCTVTIGLTIKIMNQILKAY